MDKVEIMFVHEEIKMERIITLERKNITYRVAARASRVSVSTDKKRLHKMQHNISSKEEVFYSVTAKRVTQYFFAAAVLLCCCVVGNERHNEFNNGLEESEKFH